ncbi:ABC transporter substrate-binding protein [Myceligenerans pegani]|uniref:ABC transporter substrate-binding protein n=1 Tax=Myceligenerans pegani TaxID=2776917 RepID=A0ABR9N3G0_9MICO|nr:ABC transporter substrate-binding protein [Myceligenerans sp. TRM 65318]MBE1877746.1 ABC transporter substrate-binding protein [Myceligenerans sp. TRM 65318]MBE3020017.1 ABC transporter substrate-binding protein [Myceligenerans sp. TRM 65318]
MRRTAPLSLAMIALLGLSACGSGDTGAGGSLQGEGSGADCTIPGPVPVGAALSLTGAAGSYGESQRNGLELAAAHLNEQGGVTYELTVEDDQTDERQGITLFEQFTDDGVSAIIGPTLSTTAFQAQPIAQDAGVPVVAISNTADGITEQGEYIHRVSLTEGQVIPQTVAAVTESEDLENVVVMYSDDDAFTESGYEVFAQALEDEGVEVAETLTFSVADTDFRPLLTEAAKAEPDAVIVSALIEAAIPLVTQAREIGLDVPIVGGNGFNNPQLMTDAGEAAEGVVVGAAWNSAATQNELNTDFLAAYEAEYGKAPDQFAAQAYTGLMTIDAAVRAECSGEPEAIKDGLGTIDGLDTVLGSLTINDARDAEHEAVVQVVTDGEFVALD